MVSYPALLAVGAGLLYGVGDYVAGIVGRKVPPLKVAVLAHGAAVVPLITLAGLWSTEAIMIRDLAVGGMSGVALGLGIACLYMGLAMGPMSVVAPVSALTGAAVPVIVAVSGGTGLNVFATVGIALGMLATTLVSLDTRSKQALAFRPIALAVIAGGGLGGAVSVLSLLDAEVGIWPLVPGRVVAVVVMAVALLLPRRPVRALQPFPKRLGAVTALVGLADGCGSAFVLLALTGGGNLAVVGVLIALYPVPVVVLARVFSRERLHPVQWAGVSLSMVAVALLGSLG